MTESTSARQNNKDLVFVAALLSAGLVLFELWLATTNHANNRDQHLSTAVAYAKGHIDLLRPMLPGFTVNGTPTPLEFPAWQALTAVFMKCFGIWFGWGNVVSLFFFFGSLWPLFDLCRRLGSSRIGWWAVLFTLVQPLSWLEGGRAGGDGTAWAFAMWFIYASYRMMSEGKWLWWGGAICAGVLSALTKAPFFMTAGLTTFFWLLLGYRRSARAWFFLVSAGVVACVFFLAWNGHCHRVYAEAEFSTWNLDPFAKDAQVNKWYFGDKAYRLNPANWFRLIWHLGASIMGGFIFVVLLFLAARLRKSWEAWLWLIGAVCTAVVFPPLFVEHLHYFFIFAPAAAWLCALGAVEIETGFWERLRIPFFGRVTILLVALVTSLIGPAFILHANASIFDPYVAEVTQTIKDHTTSDEKIVVLGLDWGQAFVRADRQGYNGGISVHDGDWMNDPHKLERLKQLGYTKLILVNVSPVRIAVTHSTPHLKGRGNKDTSDLENLHEALPAVAKDWPVVYDSPQVLIVQIPNSQPGN